MAIRHAAAALAAALFLVANLAPLHVRAAGSTSDLLAAVNNVSTQSNKFRSLMSNISASQIHMVNVQSVMSDEGAYRKALHKNASDISDLRDTLNHTTVTGNDGVLITLRNLLLRQNITIDRVTGVYVTADGQITLFYQ